MGLGVDYDDCAGECRTCGEVTYSEDEVCKCCRECGGHGRRTSGLGAGKGYKFITCEACEGSGRTPAELDEDACDEDCLECAAEAAERIGPQAAAAAAPLEKAS